MDGITVVLVGASGYGFNYFTRIAKLKAEFSIALVGIVDVFYEKCPLYEELQSQGIPFYRKLDEFYQDKQADLAIIAAPIHFHKELSILALQKGSNVLCEKPAAGCYADAFAMQKAAEQYGKFLIVGFQWSYSSSIEQLKKDILAGVFGKAKMAKSIVLWPRTLDYYDRSWAGCDIIDGKYVMDSVASNATAHYIHNMLFLLGKSMYEAAQTTLQNAAIYRANDIKTFDAYELSLETDDGVKIFAYGAHCVDKIVHPILKMNFEDADIDLNMNTNDMIATFHDGSTKLYAAPDSETTDIRVLAAALQAIKSGDVSGILCDIHTAMQHVKLMDMLNAKIKYVHTFSEHEVARIPKKGTVLVVAKGLADKLLDHFEKETI